jgi:hypothetical protein
MPGFTAVLSYRKRLKSGKYVLPVNKCRLNYLEADYTAKRYAIFYKTSKTKAGHYPAPVNK